MFLIRRAMLFVALFAVACGGGSSTPSASDGGTDAAFPADSGTDGGADASVFPSDAGTDAGEPDAGGVDSGPVDAGPQCLVTEAAVNGQCVPKFSSLSTGWDHSCILRADRTAACWGANDSSQIGDGTTNTATTPVAVGSDWANIDARGEQFSCGVKSDGTLWCWGNGQQNELGNGSTSGLLTPTQVGSDTDWTIVSATFADNSACALKTNHTLWCWGYNGDNELGDGTTDNALAPEQVGTDADWASLQMGDGWGCAVKTGGTLWCWGGNGGGNLDNGSSGDNAPVPAQAGSDQDWSAVSCGDENCCAIKTGGTLWCWGYNPNGEDGDGTTNENDSAVQVGSDADWAAISAGDIHTCGIKTDGSGWCWGDNSLGELGDGTTDNHTTPEQITGGHVWLAIQAGSGMTCGVAGDGTLDCWGSQSGTEDQSAGMLGVASAPASGIVASPTVIVPGSWNTVSAGAVVSCAVSDTGLWCWGDNSRGAVGDGTMTTTATPVQIVPSQVWNSVTVSPDATAEFACGVQSMDSSLWCWGANTSGQLGNGTTTDSATPVELFLPNFGWRSASANDSRVCAVDNMGELWCWGATFNTTTPVQVGTDVWNTVSTGGAFQCGLKLDNSLWCWGSGAMGELGLGDPTHADQTTPQPVGADTDWASVAAGATHACAVKMSGDLYCWGDNTSGELGIGTTTSSDAPVLVSGGMEWGQAAAGAGVSCAISTANTLWCWGSNTSSRLAQDASVSMETAPTQIGTGLWGNMSIAPARVLGRDWGGAVEFWGDASGLISLVDNPTPLVVLR